MQRVLIIGAGGHAQVVADILMRGHDAGEAAYPLGYLDDNPALQGETLLGLPVLGGIADLPNVDHDAVIIAIGHNRTRQRLFAQLQQQGQQFVIARHPSAVIAPDVRIGPGTMVCAGAIINPGSVIDANAIVNTGCTVDHHNRIGKHVHLAPGVHLGGNVTISEGALVGIGAVIMPQRRIGAWSVVGAGALAHTDVPDRVVVAGVPSRIIKHIEEE